MLDSDPFSPSRFLSRAVFSCSSLALSVSTSFLIFSSLAKASSVFCTFSSNFCRSSEQDGSASIFYRIFINDQNTLEYLRDQTNFSIPSSLWT
ncbi:hypothetical protein LSTR_LSTR016069 [Laodelphax striatellus]|uniref:Uncharacterized protein n=1 Tax=Laodelphax striatellus TaxID=195883 RepID=A0A482WS43_LAOST|nr:hypothetical protein LSTR_LSTR016069 [Laodelphax striatellus]